MCRLITFLLCHWPDYHVKGVELYEFFEYNHPKTYQQSRDAIWVDPYISQQLLIAQLNQTTESASRKLSFISAFVERIASLIEILQNCAVLDLGCRPGLYAEKLALREYSITGIDFSKASIAYAKITAKEKRLAIKYL